ncbi:hypothetical protein [Cypionkella sinensis]|uniref:DNA pilot protein n=1 Tax=Cypionkella sinensis TaxID=1756043 RepID=A0ABV7J0F2_9RHOB
MQAALLPLLGGTAASATAATTAATMFSAGSSILGGVGAASEAAAAKQQAKISAQIGQARANQTNTTARQDLGSELSTLRATLAANGQRPNSGTAEVFSAMRDTRNRERRIEVGNRMQEAADYSAQARSIRPGQSVMAGVFKSGLSLFDLAELNRVGKLNDIRSSRRSNPFLR